MASRKESPGESLQEGVSRKGVSRRGSGQMDVRFEFSVFFHIG